MKESVRDEDAEESRIPFGFVEPEIVVNDAVQIIPDATLYHFGILTSNVHMAWMRTVCGCLKSDYRYLKDIVYNNFPWPDPSDSQKATIEKTAQAIPCLWRESRTSGSVEGLAS